MVRTLSRTVKSLRFHFTSQQVRLPAFHGSWQKTWDSWIGAKQVYTNSTSSTSFMFLSVPLVPQVPWERCRVAQVGAWAYSWFASQLRNPKFRVPESFVMSSSKSAQLLLWGEHYLYYTGQQTYLPFSWEVTVSSKSVHYINLLGKESGRKVCQSFSLLTRCEKCKKFMENCFPTDISQLFIQL